MGTLDDQPVFHKVEDCDECPGKWDPPGHLKLKTQKLCSYCSLKERINVNAVETDYTQKRPLDSKG